jgi:predicted HD phosphohydrolase
MQPYSTFLTNRFDLAFHLASGLHHAQPRKETNVPYIAHLMSVCALVFESGGDEDLAIAALLHDAVEDQGGLPTLETIRHLFGDRVALPLKVRAGRPSPSSSIYGGNRHFYTASWDEVQADIGWGWRYEGIQCFLPVGP